MTIALLNGLQRFGKGGRDVSNQILPGAAVSDSVTRASQESWISKRPSRCGGDACIRDTRIPVWILVNYRRLGGTDNQILADYPLLTPDDLEFGWVYAAANREEIDSAILENEDGEEGAVE